MKKAQPSNLEMQVLAILWQQKAATARDVLTALPDGKQRAYTTVLSVLQVMEKKGLVKHIADGNRHIYSPLVKKSEVMGSFFRSLVQQLFSGKASHAMQHLLETSEVTPEEIAEMRATLDDYAQKQTTPKTKKK